MGKKREQLIIKDRGGTRAGNDRRKNLQQYDGTERRSGRDRRSGIDRRRPVQARMKRKLERRRLYMDLHE